MTRTAYTGRRPRQQQGSSKKTALAMKQDPVERLAFSIARRLRSVLGHPNTATANEHACGYGTVCLWGHPILASLWLQCVDSQPTRALLEVERDSASMSPIKSKHVRYDPQSGIPPLPMVIHRDTDTTISLVTRMWVLDELRWLSQSDSTDLPRTVLDTMLSKLNHGDMIVAIHLSDLTSLLKRAIENNASAVC
jgi:hypothetical protein